MNSHLQPFSLECRKVTGFAFLRCMIDLNHSHHFFIQSEKEPKSIVTRSHVFYRASHQLQLLLRDLIDIWDCMCPLGLAKEII